MTDAVELLLTTAFRHVISEPNVEAGFERFQSITGGVVRYDAFRDAIDTCLRERLICEPVRLPEGALQCHWRLELTPAGVALARTIKPPESESSGFTRLYGNGGIHQ